MQDIDSEDIDSEAGDHTTSRMSISKTLLYPEYSELIYFNMNKERRIWITQSLKSSDPSEWNRKA